MSEQEVLDIVESTLYSPHKGYCTRRLPYHAYFLLL